MKVFLTCDSPAWCYLGLKLRECFVHQGNVVLGRGICRQQFTAHRCPLGPLAREHESDIWSRFGICQLAWGQELWDLRAVGDSEGPPRQVLSPDSESVGRVSKRIRILCKKLSVSLCASLGRLGVICRVYKKPGLRFNSLLILNCPVRCRCVHTK